MMANKLDTAMWLSRLFTVYCSALFVLPVLGYVSHRFSAFDTQLFGGFSRTAFYVPGLLNCKRF